MSNETIELFERYLNNQMGEDDKVAFLQSLNLDEELKENFKTFKVLHAGIKYQSVMEKFNHLNQHAKKTNHTPSENEKTNQFKNIKLFILLLIGSLFVYLMYTQFSSSDVHQSSVLKSLPEGASKDIDILPDTLQLRNDIQKDDTSHFKSFAASDNNDELRKLALELYRQPQNFEEIYRAETVEKNDDFQKAIGLFYDKKYTEALSLLEVAEEDNSKYLKAHILFNTGNYIESEKLFRAFYEDDFSLWHEESKYYLLLTWLQHASDHKKEINKILTQIGNKNDYKIQISKITKMLKISN